MIIVFTGSGKGKSSTDLGTALRALGWNKNVVILRCFKGYQKTGEDCMLNSLSTCYSKLLYNYPINRWLNKSDKKGIEIIKIAIEKANEIIENKQTFLLIIDELNVGFTFDIMSHKTVVDLIKKAKKRKVHLVFTGKGPDKLNKHADIITQVCEIKHIYRRGKLATKGIDH